MDFLNNDINIFGETNFRSGAVRFGIRTDDRRRHVYVIGKTGSGKTNFSELMAINDIRAGHGVAVVDPHGEFAEKMLDFIPEHRIDDVIYFNPSDTAYPIAFNPLEKVATEHRHLVASGLMGIFKKIWVDMWSARMEYILNNTLLALLEFPDSTLLGVMRMFSEPEYRKKIVSNLSDPVIKAFWVNEYAKYSQRFESEAVAAIQNKIGQFISNPLIRNIVGQPHSTINMRRIMDEGKILIVNVSKGRIGEDNMALLGAMIITRLQLAAMGRVDVPESQRRDFFLYVDEFQNFATESFANILSEARKYRLSLILAHQYIEQLDEKVRAAVFGNVGTLVCFRIGAADAEFLEKEFMPEFEATDLVNLENYTVYMRLLIDGIASRPFSAKILPPLTPPAENFKDIIVANSREKYALPRAVVDEKIANEWKNDSEAVVGDKIGRRDEQSLRSVLRPDIETVARSPFMHPAYPARDIKKPSFSPQRNGVQSRPGGEIRRDRPPYEIKPYEAPRTSSARPNVEDLRRTLSEKFGNERERGPRPVRPEERMTGGPNETKPETPLQTGRAAFGEPRPSGRGMPPHEPPQEGQA